MTIATRQFTPIPERVENDVEANCIKWLQRLGWTPRRKHVGLFYTANKVPIHIGKPGEADWCFMRDRRYQFDYFEVEFKRPGKTPTDRQREYVAAMNHKGIMVTWVDSLECLKAWYRATVDSTAAD